MSSTDLVTQTTTKAKEGGFTAFYLVSGAVLGAVVSRIITLDPFADKGKMIFSFALQGVVLGLLGNMYVDATVDYLPDIDNKDSAVHRGYAVFMAAAVVALTARDKEISAAVIARNVLA